MERAALAASVAARVRAWPGRLVAPVLVLLLCASSPAVERTLQNDGWLEDQQAAFQAGFVANEIGAVVLGAPPGDYPLRIRKVQLLFAGGPVGVEKFVGLSIWRDTGANNPGALLFAQEYLLTAAPTALHEIVIENLVVQDGDFRVGIVFHHSGPPAIARDDDGTIAVGRNLIYAEGLGWLPSAIFGLTGDWIIRAVVEPSSPPPAPRDLTARAGVGEVVLDWSDPGPGEPAPSGYNVYRSAGPGGPFLKVNSALVSTSAYTDQAIQDDIEHCYRVRAVSATGRESTDSSMACATVRAEPTFRRSDVDGSGRTDISDPIYVLEFLFRGKERPPCPDAADFDDGGSLDLGDALSILNWLFQNGPAPAMPGAQACGPDPVAEEPPLPACDYERSRC